MYKCNIYTEMKQQLYSSWENVCVCVCVCVVCQGILQGFPNLCPTSVRASFYNKYGCCCSIGLCQEVSRGPLKSFLDVNTKRLSLSLCVQKLFPHTTHYLLLSPRTIAGLSLSCFLSLIHLSSYRKT